MLKYLTVLLLTLTACGQEHQINGSETPLALGKINGTFALIAYEINVDECLQNTRFFITENSVIDCSQKPYFKIAILPLIECDDSEEYQDGEVYESMCYKFESNSNEYDLLIDIIRNGRVLFES